MGFNPRYRQWTAANWRSVAPTVTDLKRTRWPIFARCHLCSFEQDVRLDRLIAECGPDYILWGRTASCRRRRCHGRMFFYASPPQANGDVEMF